MRLLKFLLPLFASTLCFAAQADRITGSIDSNHANPLARSHHIKAQPQYDLGVADPALQLNYITLLMAPSRKVVWRRAANVTGSDSKPLSDARHKMASVPVTVKPSCCATAAPSRSSISRAAACSC